MIRTAFTELLGIDHPIAQSGMGRATSPVAGPSSDRELRCLAVMWGDVSGALQTRICSWSR